MKPGGVQMAHPSGNPSLLRAFTRLFDRKTSGMPRLPVLGKNRVASRIYADYAHT